MTALVFSLALWVAAAGQVSLLLVSTNVPRLLGWRDDLPKLRTFNRRLFKVFGGYAVGTYLAFAALTAYLHGELVAGTKATDALALFLGVYWLARLVLEFGYLAHDLWPRGRLFALGHVVLDLGYAYLAVTYLGLVVWHWLT